MNRARYLGRRVGAALLTVWVAVTFNFLLLRLMPGNPTNRLARVPNGSEAVRKELVKQFGLDRPLWEQYWAYLRELLHGNFGISFTDQQPVSEHLLLALRNTLPMVALGTVVAIVLGVATGLLAAW